MMQILAPVFRQVKLKYLQLNEADYCPMLCKMAIVPQINLAWHVFGKIYIDLKLNHETVPYSDRIRYFA